MRRIIEFNKIKIPELTMPSGYTIRTVNISEATEKDVDAWNFVHSFFRRSPFPKEEGIVVFVELDGEPVGVTSCLIPQRFKGEMGYPQAGCVLPEHRRKGLLRAMTVVRLRYCRDKKVERIHVAARPWLTTFWESFIEE